MLHNCYHLVLLEGMSLHVTLLLSFGPFGRNRQVLHIRALAAVRFGLTTSEYLNP